MTASETPIVFRCGGAPTVGIVHGVSAPADLGMVVVVGGPQYRVGSHRQFTLLARAVARTGIPVLRFDHSGIGDSLGRPKSFDALHTDIRDAIDELVHRTSVDHVVIWGLCDAASAAMIYAPSDDRVRGLVLLNPWVHTEEAESRVRLETYYLGRLKSKGFWRRVVRLEIDWRESAASFLGHTRNALSRRTPGDVGDDVGFIERMRRGLEAFAHPVYVILSGNDLTADEFRNLVRDDPAWAAIARSRITATYELDDANHTFASRQWRESVEQRTVQWIAELAAAKQ